VANAISAFHSMKRFGFSLGMEEFHGLLNSLCWYKNVQDAEHLLLCNKERFPFETKSFNIVLNGWSNIMINLHESKRFWRNMDLQGIRKDLISYSSMISCFSKTGNLKDVLKLFDQMKENGIEPDRKAYNAVIHALAKGRCMDKARALVKMMEESGFKPDTITYNSLIRALCKSKRSDDAKLVFDEMSKRRISPSLVSFHPLLHVARSSDGVFELLSQMQNVGCVPSMDTYIMLIRKFCRWKQFDSVLKLWHDVMPNNGFSPDRSAYIVLIHGLFLNGRLEDAANFYEEMKNKGFHPEPKTEEMIQACISGREAASRPKLGAITRYKGFVVVKDKN
jgi:pentatricopeptide repeat protein